MKTTRSEHAANLALSTRSDTRSRIDATQSWAKPARRKDIRARSSLRAIHRFQTGRASIVGMMTAACLTLAWVCLGFMGSDRLYAIPAVLFLFATVLGMEVQSQRSRVTRRRDAARFPLYSR